MSKRLTTLLVVLVAALFCVSGFAWLRLNAARSTAMADARDLARVRADVEDLDAWHVTTAGDNDGTPDASDFNRRIRSAASAAGLVDRLVSVEPGPTVRVRDSDTVRTPIYLRLESITLRQLVAFLHGLTSTDAAVRVTGVDLSAPPAPAGQNAGTETWVADVTLSESAVAAGGS